MMKYHKGVASKPPLQFLIFIIEYNDEDSRNINENLIDHAHLIGNKLINIS